MSFKSTGQLDLKPEPGAIDQGDAADPTMTSKRRSPKMRTTDPSTGLGEDLETKTKVMSIHLLEMIELIMVWVD